MVRDPYIYIEILRWGVEGIEFLPSYIFVIYGELVTIVGLKFGRVTT